MTGTIRILARGVAPAVLALALLSVTGCASDGSNPNREPRLEDREEQQRLPGFTPFSA